MFKVPFYSLQNYQTIVGKPYSEQGIDAWINLQDFLQVLTPDFIASYAQVDAR
ncbi:MAG: hypothetical protein GXP45_05300 [bacterium]|nr:hypothetical protein [bacterium]